MSYKFDKKTISKNYTSQNLMTFISYIEQRSLAQRNEIA